MSNKFYYQIDSYKKINVIFSFLIVFIFLYSFIAPYVVFTIPSSCVGMPLIYCKSRGLTRAFSEIIRFNFANALVYNLYSLKIFCFFLMQLLARISIYKIIEVNNFKTILFFDIILSILLFLFSFYNLILF